MAAMMALRIGVVGAKVANGVLVDALRAAGIYKISNNNNLFIIPEIHQSGYRTCQ